MHVNLLATLSKPVLIAEPRPIFLFLIIFTKGNSFWTSKTFLKELSLLKSSIKHNSKLIRN